MPDLPSSLALTTIADGADIVASDHRNNYAAISTAVNANITALSGGTAGQFLSAVDSDTVAWKTRFLGGLVSSAGALVSGAGWSATKNSTGNYTVTFTAAFSAAPVVVVCLADHSNNGAIDLDASSVATTGFTYFTYNSSFVNADRGASFLVFGS